MNGKMSVVVIAFLLGIIGYQNGVLDSFLHKGVKCNSIEATNLAKEIAIDKLIKPALNKMKNVNHMNYNIDNFELSSIITKKYDKNTGYHECSATSTIVGTFKFPNAKKDFNPNFFFGYLFGSDDIISLGNNQYKIISPVWYSTEITDNKEQYYVKLKFNGDRMKFLQH